MSIYSGFATRFQEQSYDHCIDSLLYLLQKRIIRFYMGQPADQQKFISLVMKISLQMKKMQKSKYLQPKSSESIGQLVKFMQLYQQNILAGTKMETTEPSNVPRDEKQQATPSIQEQAQKKKSAFWVERVVQDTVNNQQTAKQSESNPLRMQKPGSLTNKQKKMAQFRRTNYQTNNIRGIKLKPTSRTNLSRDKDNSSITNQSKTQKPRSNSTYLHQKSNIYASKVTYMDSLDQNTDIKPLNFKINPSNPNEIKPVASRSEADDIIKDYIVKMKRQKKKSRSGWNNNQYYVPGKGLEF